MREDREFRRVDLAIDLVHERKIDSGDELDTGRVIWIRLAASDLEAVDAVLVHGLQSIRARRCQWRVKSPDGEDDGVRSRVALRRTRTYMSWTDDGAVPVAHHDIVPVLETVGARAIADALLALLELLQEAEVSWNYEPVF